MTKSDPAAFELNIARTFDAPLDLVWRIWTHRDHVLKWWGPKDYETTDVDWDFRVGGAYRVVIANTSGGGNSMGGRFIEIVPNERIVLTFAWSPGNDPIGQETLITVTFSEANGRTTQTFHQSAFRDADTRDSHVGGWTQVIDREQAYIDAAAKNQGDKS